MIAIVVGISFLSISIHFRNQSNSKNTDTEKFTVSLSAPIPILTEYVPHFLDIEIANPFENEVSLVGLNLF